MPHNIQTQVCDPVVASALDWIDWCSMAENYWCDSDIPEDNNEESVNMQELINSLNVLSSNQETIYNQMNDYYSSVMQKLSSLADMYYSAEGEPVAEPVIDKREQQRLELKAQIEALQYQMDNL